MKTIESYLQSQVNTLKAENAKVSELLDRKTDRLDKERDEHYNTKNNLQAEVQNLKDKVANVEDELEREVKRGGNVIFI